MVDSVPNIETERLLLREPRESDIPAMVEHLNNWESVRYTAGIPYPYLPRDAKRFILRNHQRPINDVAGYAIIRKEDNQWIGQAGFNYMKNGEASLGYMLGRAFFGKGFMREAVSALIDEAFTRVRALEKISAEVVIQNSASHRLLLAVGFSASKEILCCSQARGGEFPGVEYLLTRSEWEVR